MKTKHETKRETSGLRLLGEANVYDEDVLAAGREAPCGRGRGLFIHVRR